MMEVIMKMIVMYKQLQYYSITTVVTLKVKMVKTKIKNISLIAKITVMITFINNMMSCDKNDS